MEKKLSIVFWVIASGAYMWLYSLASPGDLPEEPTISDVADVLSHFVLMSLGVGGAYHYMTLLASEPLNDENKAQWRKMLSKLMLCTLLVLSVPVVCIAVKYSIFHPWGFVIAYFWVCSAMLGSLFLYSKVEDDFKGFRAT